MSVKRHVAAALCAVLVPLWLSVDASAQDVSSTNLKAAYILKFVPFVEWPTEVLAPGGAVTLCVVGDSAMRDALERTIKGATTATRTFVVTFGPPGNPPAPCHILYVSAVSSAQAARVIEGVRGRPVLTISDLEGFNRMHGIIEFYYDEASQLRFSFKLSAIKEAGILISSRLLNGARLIP
jgi:hypothetical protein